MTTTQTYGATPGITAAVETTEGVIWWGRWEHTLYDDNYFLDSTAVDAGNTPTTMLRPGLLLGLKTSDSNLYQADGDGSDGTEVVEAVLSEGISMLDSDGSAEDKTPHVQVRGGVKASDL